jgi:hypothetical protein
MIRTALLCAVVVVLVGTGIAIAAVPTPVPNAAPDFSSLNFLLGTWQCHQNVPGRPGDRKETDTYSMSYDGWQMKDHAVSPPFDKYRTRDDVNDTYTTYDSMLKLWVSQTVGNFGEYGLASSPGWVGSTMTWSGMGLDGTTFRGTVTKVSDSKYTYKNYGNTKKGGPISLQFSGYCTKS